MPKALEHWTQHFVKLSPFKRIFYCTDWKGEERRTPGNATDNPRLFHYTSTFTLHPAHTTHPLCSSNKLRVPTQPATPGCPLDNRSASTMERCYGVMEIGHQMIMCPTWIAAGVTVSSSVGLQQLVTASRGALRGAADAGLQDTKLHCCTLVWGCQLNISQLRQAHYVMAGFQRHKWDSEPTVNTFSKFPAPFLHPCSPFVKQNCNGPLSSP